VSAPRLLFYCRAGFEKGAEKLDSTDAPELAPAFRKYSEQRAAFTTELQSLAQQYGDQLDADGSLAGTLHRGWLSLKDALAGSKPDGVIAARVDTARNSAISPSVNGRSIAANSKYWYSLMVTMVARLRPERHRATGPCEAT